MPLSEVAPGVVDSEEAQKAVAAYVMAEISEVKNTKYPDLVAKVKNFIVLQHVMLVMVKMAQEWVVWHQILLNMEHQHLWLKCLKKAKKDILVLCQLLKLKC